MVTHRHASSPAHQWPGAAFWRQSIPGSGMVGEEVLIFKRKTKLLFKVREQISPFEAQRLFAALPSP
jgi:hypothetical protein